ncbi:TetR/AcrR family transcriptional regulator [Actinoplanes sp. M2I2]|uniref:TetR/AcrR family transcriptional regulator n=1 Tax=Actinoplanes sp. M2I2 TaxID=1734444 RepID=UPI0020214826|nr:TetR/AcrR family transcriptional regulator [Actinoplanes sp. M2I2]
MPRQVDHDERRRHIAAAVWRIAAVGGLEDATIRRVAAEAGVPARQLQYYFGSRDDLLLGALDLLNKEGEAEAQERVAALGPAPTPRQILRSVLLEFLPLDESRRRRQLVHAAYFVRFLGDDTLRERIRDTPPELEGLIALLLPEDRRDEADFLLAGAAGLQGQVLLGQMTAERAVDLIDRQLDRVFAASA